MVLDCLAGRLVICGGPGAGQVAKACNQLVVTANLGRRRRGARARGLARRRRGEGARRANGRYASSRILELQGERMLRRDFSLGGSVRNHVKDIGIIRSLGAQDSTEVFEAAARALEQLAATGAGTSTAAP